MREDHIQKSLNFLKTETTPKTSFDEKIGFLRGKLTEEELSEVMNRYKSSNASSTAPIASTTLSSSHVPSATPVSHSIPSQPEVRYVEQPRSAGSRFIDMLNIGAISTATGLGVSYVVNSLSDKKDEQVLQ